MLKCALLRDLNDGQRKAVLHREGPMLVTAGPGSGKTHVITTRLLIMIHVYQIPPEKIKFIFDRFFKGDTSRNRNNSGSGLGLYITKTIIKQHGGDIFVRSDETKTEFCFTIPLSK